MYYKILKKMRKNSKLFLILFFKFTSHANNTAIFMFTEIQVFSLCFLFPFFSNFSFYYIVKKIFQRFEYLNFENERIFAWQTSADKHLWKKGTNLKLSKLKWDLKISFRSIWIDRIIIQRTELNYCTIFFNEIITV